MTGIENTITNAAAPALIVFLFIGYLSKRDESIRIALHELSESNSQLKETLQNLYIELIKKNEINKRKSTKTDLSS